MLKSKMPLPLMRHLCRAMALKSKLIVVLARMCAVALARISMWWVACAMVK